MSRFCFFLFCKIASAVHPRHYLRFHCWNLLLYLQHGFKTFHQTTPSASISNIVSRLYSALLASTFTTTETFNLMTASLFEWLPLALVLNGSTEIFEGITIKLLNKQRKPGKLLINNVYIYLYIYI